MNVNFRKKLELYLMSSSCARFVLSFSPMWLVVQLTLLGVPLLDQWFGLDAGPVRGSQHLRGVLLFYGMLFYMVVGLLLGVSALFLIGAFRSECERFDEEHRPAFKKCTPPPLSKGGAWFFRIVGTYNLVASLAALTPMASAIGLCWLSLAYAQRLPNVVWFFGYSVGATLMLYGLGAAFGLVLWLPEQAKRAREQMQRQARPSTPPPLPPTESPPSPPPTRTRRRKKSGPKPRGMRAAWAQSL